MVNVVGIVGFQNSGKTTLTKALASELVGRGHKVAVIKHSSHHLDLSEKDAATLGWTVDQVGFISPQESAILWKRRLSLENTLPYLDADIVLVEGFKEGQTFPKIVCLRGEPDDRRLFDGLAICAVGPADQVERIGVPLLGRDEVAMIADLVEQKGFKLPALDCEGCGYERCFDLAHDIVVGTGCGEDCVSLRPTTEVRIDGQSLPMNPFIASIVRGTILGMLSPLKGFKKGTIEIRL